MILYYLSYISYLLKVFQQCFGGKILFRKLDSLLANWFSWDHLGKQGNVWSGCSGTGLDRGTRLVFVKVNRKSCDFQFCADGSLGCDVTYINHKHLLVWSHRNLKGHFSRRVVPLSLSFRPGLTLCSVFSIPTPCSHLPKAGTQVQVSLSGGTVCRKHCIRKADFQVLGCSTASRSPLT